VTAKSLRQALAQAISMLPKNRDSCAKREAVRKWRRDVTRRAFDAHQALRNRENSLLYGNVLRGRDLNVCKITPQIVPCRTEQDLLTFSYFSLCSSFPSGDRPGRRLKFLVRDVGQPGHPLIGICCLSSPVRQLRVRDEWIGWQESKYRSTRARNLVYISDLSTCISMPPYSFLTGGKLLAALMTSDDVRRLYRERYHEQLTLRQSLLADELYLLTTSGCYGSNSPMYKGMRCKGRTLYHFLGYSKGYSHFQIDPTLYEDVKRFVARRLPETAGRFRTWSNSKIRVLRLAARELKISEEILVFTGHQRAVFAAPLAENWRQLLLGDHVSADVISYPSCEIVEYWKEKWLARRLQSCETLAAVRRSSPAGVRVSRVLEARGEKNQP
jgi:hypothetical protein